MVKGRAVQSRVKAGSKRNPSPDFWPVQRHPSRNQEKALIFKQTLGVNSYKPLSYYSPTALDIVLVILL